MLKRNFNIVKKSVFALLVFIFIVFTIGIIPSIDPNNKNKIILSAASWKTDMAEITEVSDVSTNHYVSITKFIDIDEVEYLEYIDENHFVKNPHFGLLNEVYNPANVTISENINGITEENKKTIFITISNGLELYYFTEICNAVLADGETSNEYYDNYLKLNYILTNDINYEEASKTFKMLRPIGHEEKYSFSGTFNGQGFTISNIFFRPFEDEKEIMLYKEMLALSWFSQNSGTISNVGIINPNMIQYDIYERMIYATPFVGINTAGGTVENCYVQDLRGNTAGLSAEGGYDISMFAATNAGTIKNCYVATNRIHSSQVSITKQEQRHPFIFSNTGTITNCYFDRDIILGSINTNSYDGLKGIKTGDFINGEFKHVDVYHSNFTYTEYTGNPEYSQYLNLKYPVLHGFNIDKDKYFLIEDVNDFVYMFNLIDQYPPFRSAKYKLIGDIDLNMVDKDALVLSNSAFTGEFIGGKKVADNIKYKITLANGKESTNYAISNLNIEAGITNEGNHYYGLFSTVSGVVSNIDLINVNVQLNDYTDVIADTTKLVGTVCGKLEGGSIENVNVNAEIKVNENGNNTFLGKTYVGGICAYATGGKITGCTTNGTLVGGTYNPTSNSMSVDLSSYYGGIVGRVDNNDGVINCLNSLDITAPTYTSTPGAQLRQYTGGVIGGGKLNNCTNLQNDGVITVGSTNSTAFYAKPYIGGVVGRVESTSNANGVYFNNANINYFVTNNNLKAYISGVLNAISLTADKYDTFNGTGLAAADVQSALNKESKFEFTSLTNGGILNVENNVTSSTLKPAKYQAFDNAVTTGYDIRCAGVTYSYLTNMNVLGGYNLDAHYVRNNGAYTEVKNSAQSIDISMIDKYAPTFNADNQIAIVNNKVHLDTNYIRSNSDTVKTNIVLNKTTVNLERVYNSNDTHYITNKTVNAYTLNLSGCLNGFNMNLKNIRNDGDVKVYFKNDTHANTKLNTYLGYFGDYRKLKVYGVFEEVSLDHRAESVYNGGNITISSSTNVTPAFTMYVGGLCYKNIGNDKPGDSLMIKSGYRGSLHNSLNSGTIRITQGDIIEGNPTVSGNFYSQSRIGGICAFNCSTISQTFNLGDIYNINHVYKRNDSEYGTYGAAEEFEVETGGFCFSQSNEVYNANGDYTKANIIDSANSGTIIAMNTNSADDTWTNAGGFVARNERGEDAKLINASGSSSVYAHQQKIQYSINYGDVIAYNLDGDDSATTTGEPCSKAAGFVCLGACTVVDVINYGNIYGSRVVSGMFSYVDFDKFTGATTGRVSASDPIYIANAINYGKATTIDLIDENTAKLYSVSDSTTFKTTDHITTSDNSTHYPVGALIGMISSPNLSSMKIKNLVNFNEKLDIVGRTDTGWFYNESNSVRIETLQYMATVKDADYSPEPFNSNRNGVLNTYGIKSYSLDTTAGIKQGSEIFSKAYNGGIFNENYTLRTAPALLDENGNIVTDPTLADPNNTDNFISDYIQFIPYSKVNDYLVSKIGLDKAVLDIALENAIDNYEIIQNILVYLNTKDVPEGTEPTYIDNAYNALINQYSEDLERYKHTIVNKLSNYLKSSASGANEARAIFDIIIEDYDSLQAACKSTLVSDIVKVLVNNMSNENVESLINGLSLSKYVEILVEHPDEFAAYVEYVLNSSEKKDDIDTIKAVTQIFESLVSGDASVASYVQSLDVDTRKALAKELYDMFNSDTVIQGALIKTYPSITITNAEDLEALLDVVFPNETTVTNGDITNQEYENMYYELLAYNMTYTDVVDRINELNAQEMSDLIAAFSENMVTTNPLFDFFDTGRKGNTGIYLPANMYNYVAIIDSDDFRYISSTGVTNVNNNEVYSGNSQYITGPNDNLYSAELKIMNGNYESVQNFSSWLGNDQRIVFSWWTPNDQENVTMFTYNASTSKNTGYVISFIDGETTSQYVTWENINTGVYGTRNSNTIALGGAGILSGRAEISDYNFSNLTIYKFIDYGRNAISKTGLDSDLTIGMAEAMNTLSSDDDYGLSDEANSDGLSYLNIIKEYLIDIYDTSFNANTDNSLSSSIAAFVKLLFKDVWNNLEDPLTLDEMVKHILQKNEDGEYVNLKATNTENNIKAILNNISNETVQKTIINLFIDNDNYDFSNILPELLNCLSNEVSTIVNNDFQNNTTNYVGDDYYDKMIDIHLDVIKFGGTHASYSDDLGNSIKTIISCLTLNEQREILGKISGVIGPEIIKENKENLTLDQIILILSQQLIFDIQLVNEYNSKLTPIFSDEIKSYFIAGIVTENDELFTEYIFDRTEYPETSEGTADALNDFQDLMEAAGLKRETVFDFAGIYALASSKGILNGLFLPDNIEMIGMDIYDETKGENDPTWRGGTADNPNNYERDEETGKPTKETINSRVFYEMKQLKQSIATVIFEMELEGIYEDENNNQVYNTITNNVDTDYFCNYKEYNTDGSYIIKNEVYFYVPINHDILNSDALYANMNAGSYELSYGATFDAATEDKTLIINLAGETLFVGRTLYDEFVIQAEDTSVKTTYTVYLVITAPSYLTEVDATINGGVDASITVHEITNEDSTVVQNAYVTGVNGYNGNLHLIYTTKNLINGLSLLDNVKVYKTNETAFSDITSFDFADCAKNSTLLELDSEYTITGGTVVIDGVTGTGYNNNFNTYDDGEVEFDIKLNNYLSKGLYLVEIKLNDDCVYYVLFEKAASDQKDLISLSYNGYLFENTTNAPDNESTPSKHSYGKPVTESFFAHYNITGKLNIKYFENNNYLSNICVYENGNANAQAPNASYRIPIKLNEDGNYYVSGKFSKDVPYTFSNDEYDYLIVIGSDELSENIFDNVKIGDNVEVIIDGDKITIKDELYLDSIITSPLSTFTIADVLLVNDSNNSKIYSVKINVIAEDGSNKVFTHYITEESYETTLNTVYYNGAVVSKENVEDLDPNGNFIFEDQFEKYETPTYGFDFALDAFYVGNQEFRVAYCDLNGNEITDEEIKAVLEENTVVSVNQGQGFNITFIDSALSQKYYIKLVYENRVENFFDITGINTSTELTWEVFFGTINIEKLKNKNSYLDNVTFISESVIASIKTLVDVKEFSETTYNTMMNSATREIVCLPGQIHYNKYAYDINKQAAFYVIGIVDKTDLSFYAPEFTLPDGASVYKIITIGDETNKKTYKAVPYYTGTDIHTLTTFYVSEDNKTIIALDQDNVATTITTEATSIETVTYNGVTYTLSPVAGKSSVEVGTEVVLNTTLYANYDDEGCFVEGATEGEGYFKYVDYRVYAEYYEEEQASTYYTDYYVATQDLTNNIRFDIEIVKDGVDLTHTNIYNVYAEFICYTLIEGAIIESFENCEIYNRAGIFGTFDNKNDNGSQYASNSALHTNTSGYYVINVSLPDGFTYKVTLHDKKLDLDSEGVQEDANGNRFKVHAAGEIIDIESSLTARKVGITITIIESETTNNNDWGQIGKNPSFYVPSQEETN